MILNFSKCPKSATATSLIYVEESTTFQAHTCKDVDAETVSSCRGVISGRFKKDTDVGFNDAGSAMVWTLEPAKRCSKGGSDWPCKNPSLHVQVHIRVRKAWDVN
jgi:hypothetical protein